MFKSYRLYLSPFRSSSLSLSLSDMQNLWHVISLRRIARDSIRAAGFARALHTPKKKRNIRGRLSVRPFVHPLVRSLTPEFSRAKIKLSAGGGGGGGGVLSRIIY